MQVNESVNASNLLTLGTQTGKKDNSKSVGGTNDFASFLSPTVSDATQNNAGVQQSETKGYSGVKSDNSVQKDRISGQTNNGNKVNESKTNENKTDAAQTQEVKDKDNKQTSDATVSVNSVDEKTTIDEEKDNVVVTTGMEDVELLEEDTDAVLQLLGDFFQQLMSELEITPDTLNETMNELGMEPSDLLSEDGMKSLFLAVNSAEVSDLLVNEELNQDWNQFEGQMVQLLDEVDIPVEDLQQVTESWDEADFLKVETMPLQETGDVKVSDIPVEKDVDVVQTKQVESDDVVVHDDFVAPDKQTQSDSGEFSKEFSEDSSENSSKEFSSQTYKSVTEDTKSAGTESTKNAKTEHFENPILQAVENAVDNLQDVPVVEEVPISGREIVNQIVEQVRVNMSQDTTSMEMQLYPEHLGKIQINVVSKDGVMTARIVAETEEAKQAIEGGLASLKESMENQNLKVDAIEVMVSTAGFTWNDEEQPEYEQQKSSNSRKKIDLSELDGEEVEVEETAELEKMRYAGSSVSYTA